MSNTETESVERREQARRQLEQQEARDQQERARKAGEAAAGSNLVGRIPGQKN